jgi:hypothetical protein
MNPEMRSSPAFSVPRPHWGRPERSSDFIRMLMQPQPFIGQKIPDRSDCYQWLSFGVRKSDEETAVAET